MAARRGEGFTEDELVGVIRKVLSGEGPGVIVGPGDDAAVLESGRGLTVATTDMLVEDVHFERSMVSARDLGAKAIVVNVSDIAAMAASPRYALVSLGFAADVDVAWVIELFGGMRAACDEYALSLVGGDLNRSPQTVVSVTVIGEVARGRAVLRSGARPGDRVVVTGTLGASAGGLLLARAGGSSVTTPWGRELMEAHFRPVARIGEAATLAQAGATAMMDISDGLLLDLSRLCAESAVGARVELDRVPVAEALGELRSAVADADPLQLALSGGEDYELLASIDPAAVEPATAKLEDRFGVRLTDIGEITDTGLTVVDAEGNERPLEAGGWDHFASR
ncbi:MAG: thiamine-phosphate kinase [Actinomycetota bacterium]